MNEHKQKNHVEVENQAVEIVKAVPLFSLFLHRYNSVDQQVLYTLVETHLAQLCVNFTKSSTFHKQNVLRIIRVEQSSDISA